jgi:hypothetical protein
LLIKNAFYEPMATPTFGLLAGILGREPKTKTPPGQFRT